MPRRTSRSSRERANRREGSKQKGYKKGAGGGGREGASPVLERKHAVRPRKPAILNLDQKVLDPSISKAKKIFTCKRTRGKDRLTD